MALGDSSQTISGKGFRRTRIRRVSPVSIPRAYLFWIISFFSCDANCFFEPLLV
jgi:hypothetical protein